MLYIYHADENYMEIHDVFSTLAKSVAKKEKKENPAPKHPIQTMNRTPWVPSLDELGWWVIITNLKQLSGDRLTPPLFFSCT